MLVTRVKMCSYTYIFGNIFGHVDLMRSNLLPPLSLVRKLSRSEFSKKTELQLCSETKLEESLIQRV